MSVKVRLPRVLVVANTLSSLVRFRGPVLHALVERGCEVHVAVPQCDVLNPESMIELADTFGVAVHVFPLRRQLDPLGDLHSLVALVRLQLAVRPDVVFSYMMKPSIYGTLSGWLASVRRRVVLLDGLGLAFVGNEHGQASPKAARVARLLLRLALGRANHVIFINADDPQTVSQQGVMKSGTSWSIVAGTGLDLSFWNARVCDPTSTIFLMISRITRHKGVREFAAAAELVRLRRPEARFMLLGERDGGPGGISQEEAQRWTWIEQPGLKSDVRPELARCLALVLPSYTEGRPRAVMEAMASARAVIATDIAGTRDCIENDVHGLLVPTNDVNALAKGMISYLEQPGLAVRHGIAGRKRAEADFEESKVVHETVDHILGVMAL